MGATIRRAVAEDAASLRALNREFNDVDVPTTRIANCLGKPSTVEHVFVAVSEEDVVGFCCIEVVQSLCSLESRGEITELFVAPSHRRKGIARLLIAAASVLANDMRTTDLFVRTNKANDAARALFASLGFLDAGHIVYRKKTRPNEIAEATPSKPAENRMPRSQSCGRRGAIHE